MRDCNCDCKGCLKEHKTYCDFCDQVCNIGNCGNSITVYFPYGHPRDMSGAFIDGCFTEQEMGEPVQFCSDECLIKYMKGGD